MIMNFRSYPSPKSQLCNKIHVLWYVCQNSKNWIWRFIFHSHILYSFVSTFQCHFCLTKWLCLNLSKSFNFFLLPSTIILKLLMWYCNFHFWIKNNFGGFFLYLFIVFFWFLNWIFKILISKPRRSCWQAGRMIKLRD